MSLPPGFLEELRDRTSIVQVVGRKVLWDTKKSNQGRGDMWAPCPFHQEKTASFHVDDSKGYYYCFGCHAKGDAISFVRESENLGFMEAVETLAQEVGMQMPAIDAAEQVRSDRRTVLVEAMEAAVAYYKHQLTTQAGRGALDYLEGRRLDQSTRNQFDIGFAPDGRQNLFKHLSDAGMAEDVLVDAGLVGKPEQGGSPYDRFRGRIIFPIRDTRGRCIALGGRAMDPNERAKYLNSPETLLFDKGRSLYNLGPARKAAGKGQPLIVAEGYMDVIALSQAGFDGAVAPLGTAITEKQLQQIWRVSPEPVIALDGDTAGKRAALRLIDLSLPLIEAGNGLRICLMPPDMDPDDVIRSGGAAAMAELLDQAQPMVALIWRRETEGQNFDSPERRATLDRRLSEITSGIADTAVRRHYEQEFKNLRWELFRPQKRSKGAGRRTPAPAGPVATTRQSRLATTGAGQERDSRCEAVILAALVRVPSLVQEFGSHLEDLDLRTPGFADVRRILLEAEAMENDEARAAIQADTPASVLENLARLDHFSDKLPSKLRSDPESMRQQVKEGLSKLIAWRGLDDEVAEAESRIADDVAVAAPGFAADAEEWNGVDDPLKFRLREASQSRLRAERETLEERIEFSTGANGMKINKDEQDELNKVMSQIRFNRTPES